MSGINGRLLVTVIFAGMVVLVGVLVLFMPAWVTIDVDSSTAATTRYSDACVVASLDGHTGSVGSTLYDSRFCDGHRQCAMMCMGLFISIGAGVVAFGAATVIGAVKLSRKRQSGGTLFTALCGIGTILYGLVCLVWLWYSSQLIDVEFVDFSCTGWPYYTLAGAVGCMGLILVLPVYCGGMTRADPYPAEEAMQLIPMRRTPMQGRLPATRRQGAPLYTSR